MREIAERPSLGIGVNLIRPGILMLLPLPDLGHHFDRNITSPPWHHHHRRSPQQSKRRARNTIARAAEEIRRSRAWERTRSHWMRWERSRSGGTSWQRGRGSGEQWGVSMGGMRAEASRRSTKPQWLRYFLCFEIRDLFANFSETMNIFFIYIIYFAAFFGLAVLDLVRSIMSLLPFKWVRVNWLGLTSSLHPLYLNFKWG